MTASTRKRRSGHFFQGRYKGILIDKDSYLLELSRYLHLNPVSIFPEDIKECLSNSLEESWEEIVKGKNKGHRNLAIYLFKQHTGLTNKQMGSICGEMSYSAVSKAYHRFKQNLQADTVLKKKVEEVMSNVKGRPHSFLFWVTA